VLVGVDDVAPGLGEEAADRGDQPRLVRAGEQQAGGRGPVGDARMIPIQAAPRIEGWSRLEPLCGEKLDHRPQDCFRVAMSRVGFVPEIVRVDTRL
jgi:hypothetical protein